MDYPTLGFPFFLLNGKPLDAHEGPLMIASTDDLRHYHGIRQVGRIALVKIKFPPP